MPKGAAPRPKYRTKAQQERKKLDDYAKGKQGLYRQPMGGTYRVGQSMHGTPTERMPDPPRRLRRGD